MNSKTKRITVVGMLCAFAFVAVALCRIPVIVFPPLNYEPKDVVIVLGGLIWGPFLSFVVSVIVSFVEMITISSTGPIGFAMNVLSSAAFACTTALIYKKKRTAAGALLGLLCGCFSMAAVMLLWNYIITPLYMGYPREAVAAMLLPVFLPFNLIKGGLNMALTLLLYKPVVTALRRSHLIAEPASGTLGKPKINAWFVLLALFMLATCVLLILAFNGHLPFGA